MNHCQVFIDGVKYQNATLPFKYGNFLDKQLDHAIVQLTRVNKQYFEPTTPVKVEITDKNGDIKTLHYIISNDNFRETPVGSGYYRHDLTLIEPTKLLEGVPVETLCFTNAGGRSIRIKIPFIVQVKIGVFTEETIANISGFEELFKLYNIYLPCVKNRTFTFPSYNDLMKALKETGVDISGQSIAEYAIYNGGMDGNLLTYTTDPNATLSYTIQEENHPFLKVTSTADSSPINLIIEFFSFGAMESVPEDKPPLVPWTIESVINRVLELERPLIYDNNAGDFVKKKRFKLGATSKDLSKILAPEFTFTRQSLREVLQTIGSYIHAEPRLVYNEETQEFDTIIYDFYGQQSYAEYYDVREKKIKRLSEYNYEDLSGKYGIEQACTALDSYMDNLVNRLNGDSSAIGQPYDGGYQSLRTENSNVRFTDTGEVFFPTSYPIHQIHKFTVYVNMEAIDITPCVYDERIYNSQLDTTKSALGESKAYALYFKQGQKGIFGFWFRAKELLGTAFSNYSILEIIRLFSGYKYSFGGLDDFEAMQKVLNLSFELVYTPIYSARISHSKSYIGDWVKYPRILNYSQGANSVELESFGENIKGAVERLGTLEKSYTFTCFNLSTIPTPGELWDDEYCISTVSVETGLEKFKVTCGLSKHFNRISEYISVSSYKRLYEVSEVMTQERECIYKDYMVITQDYPTGYMASKDCLNNTVIFAAGMLSTFMQKSNIGNVEKISSVNARLHTKQLNRLTAVTLPVIASASGNVMEFTWQYQDNYSAGQKLITIDNNGTDNYYGREVEYADYYGRGYYERFILIGKEREQTEEAFANLPEMQSGSVYSVIECPQNCYMLTRKDSRETLKRTYAVEFVTDENNIVIGSALSSYCPFIAGFKTDNPVKLYVLRSRLNKLSKTVDLSENNVIKAYEIGTEISVQNIGDGVYCLISLGKNYNSTEVGQSWAFVTPKQDGKTTTYSDEDGNIVTLTEQYGGELLLGCNVEIKDGDNVGKFTMIPTHDIYEYLKNKN